MMDIKILFFKHLFALETKNGKVEIVIVPVEQLQPDEVDKIFVEGY